MTKNLENMFSIHELKFRDSYLAEGPELKWVHQILQNYQIQEKLQTLELHLDVHDLSTGVKKINSKESKYAKKNFGETNKL